MSGTGQPEAADGRAGRARLRALVVDDERPLVQIVSTYLEREGFEVAAAFDGEQAVELARSFEPDVIVLDLMLPGINGMAFLGVLRKRYPSLPVVILSALDDPDTVARAMRQGASGFVPKSSSGEELLDALRAVLAGTVFVPQHLAKVTGGRSLTERYGIDPDVCPPAALTVLMTSISRVIVMEQALGMSSGHAETLEFVEQQLRRLEGHPLPGSAYVAWSEHRAAALAPAPEAVEQ